MSTEVKNAVSRTSGLYVDDIFAFDSMQTTGNGANSGHIKRHSLFNFSQDRPVKTISQLNFDVSGCQKFWPAGLKGSVEMEHSSDALRWGFIESLRRHLRFSLLESTRSPQRVQNSIWKAALCWWPATLRRLRCSCTCTISLLSGDLWTTHLFRFESCFLKTLAFYCCCSG